MRAVALCLGILVGSCATGCTSAIQAHARAATVAAVATQGAARVVAETSRHEARTTCPHDRYEPNTPEMRACLTPLRERWAPAEAAIGSVRATLGAWVEALEVARLAGDGADLWQPLGIAAARLVREYDALVAVLRAVAVEMPALPPMLVELTGLVGGGR